MKSVFKKAAVLLLVLVAVLNICVMVIGLFGINTQMNLLPGALLKIESGSMEPTIKAGDLIVVWETPYEELKVGDIVTFQQGTGLVTHEIVRVDGSRYVTKGIANNQEDNSIGPGEYCAKMLFVIPGGGIITDTLNSPAGLLLSVALILFLFYGMPLIEKFKAKNEENTRKIKIGMVRIAASAAAVSMLTVAPFVTAAKYVSNINQYTTAVATAKYFSSNYISKEGTTYDIKGWNGENYSIMLAIRNYSNSLLFNEIGDDLKYNIRLEKVDDSSYKTDYVMSLRRGDESLTAASSNGTEKRYGLFTIEGSDSPQSQNFNVEIDATGSSGNSLLSPKDKIHFRIYAYTESSTEYVQELVGDFVLEVAAGESFIGNRSCVQNEGTTLVTYSITTNQVGGSGTRNIKVSWNNEKLYINEYEATIQNLKLSNPGAIVRDEKVDGVSTGRGYVILPLQAYSSVSLQFFKNNAQDTILIDESVGIPDIYVAEEISSGVYDEPTAPAEPEPEEDPTE